MTTQRDQTDSLGRVECPRCYAWVRLRPTAKDMDNHHDPTASGKCWGSHRTVGEVRSEQERLRRLMAGSHS